MSAEPFPKEESGLLGVPSLSLIVDVRDAESGLIPIGPLEVVEEAYTCTRESSGKSDILPMSTRRETTAQLTPREVGLHINTIIHSLQHRLKNPAIVIDPILVVQRVEQRHVILIKDGEPVLRAVDRELVAPVEVLRQVPEARRVCTSSDRSHRHEAEEQNRQQMCSGDQVRVETNEEPPSNERRERG